MAQSSSGTWVRGRNSLTQKNVVIYLQTVYPQLFVWPEQRVRTVPGRRSRVPDVCVTLEDPHTDIFEAPPLIEILSRRDEMSDVLEKLEEYAGFEVPHIWVADPRRRKGFRFRDGRLEDGLRPAHADARVAAVQIAQQRVRRP